MTGADADPQPVTHAGDEGQRHCPAYRGANVGECCDNCLQNPNGYTVCCNAGEQLCDGPDSTGCCPPGAHPPFCVDLA